MALIFNTFRTIDFITIQAIIPYEVDLFSAFAIYDGFGSTFLITMLDAICFFLLVGVAGKSAQIGLHT